MLAAPILRVFCALMVAIGLLLAAWCVDAIFVFHIWPDGLSRLKEILAEDLDRAASIGGESARLIGLATAMANGLYALVFEMPGIHEMGMGFAERAPLSIPDTIARSAYLAHHEAIEVAMLGTQLFGVRFVLLMTGAPFLALCYAVGALDGLALRAIRQACGGSESASLYHRAKHLQVVLAALMLSAALVIPCSIDPRWVWGAGASLIALSAWAQWRYYKKHL